MSTSIFNLTLLEDQTLQKYLDDALKDLSEFFEREWLTNTPKVFVVDDRKTINSLYGKETESWLVGWPSENNIYILNPANIATESSHKTTKYDIELLIKHELCHLFFRKTFGQCNFKWINEGVSIYVSGQVNRLFRMTKHFENFLDNRKIYDEAGGAIKLLADNFGKEKLFEFLKLQHKLSTMEELNVVFERVFSEKLTYDFFNKLLISNL